MPLTRGFGSNHSQATIHAPYLSAPLLLILISLIQQKEVGNWGSGAGGLFYQVWQRESVSCSCWGAGVPLPEGTRPSPQMSSTLATSARGNQHASAVSESDQFRDRIRERNRKKRLGGLTVHKKQSSRLRTYMQGKVGRQAAKATLQAKCAVPRPPSPIVTKTKPVYKNVNMNTARVIKLHTSTEHTALQGMPLR